MDLIDDHTHLIGHYVEIIYKYDDAEAELIKRSEDSAEGYLVELVQERGKIWAVLDWGFAMEIAEGHTTINDMGFPDETYRNRQ